MTLPRSGLRACLVAAAILLAWVVRGWLAPDPVTASPGPSRVDFAYARCVASGGALVITQGHSACMDLGNVGRLLNGFTGPAS